MRKSGLVVFGVALLIGLIFQFNCNVETSGGIKGSGNSKTEKRNVADFSKIEASDAVNLEIVAQKDFDVEVEADDNLLPLIKTEVSGDTLKISTSGNTSAKTKATIKISLPKLDSLDVSGASAAVVSNVKTDSLDLEASGASKIKISGEANNLDAEASGASGIDAEGLTVSNADVKADGASSATISVTNELKADASGASSVYYTGEPKNIEPKTSGASSIKKK